MKNEKMTAEERVAHTPQHTKLPWKIGEGGWIVADVPAGEARTAQGKYGEDTYKFYGGELICESVDAPDAAFIVTACNAHEALVDALRAAEESLNEAMSLIQEDIDNRDGRDNFGISCGFCDGAIPVPHSFGCKAMTALGKGRAALSLATEVRK